MLWFLQLLGAVDWLVLEERKGVQPHLAPLSSLQTLPGFAPGFHVSMEFFSCLET